MLLWRGRLQDESDGLSVKVLEAVSSVDFSLNEDGTENNAFIVQDGFGNDVTSTHQDGIDNYGDVDMLGDGNVGSSSQVGEGNTLMVDVDGSLNTYSVVQNGMTHTSTVTQAGDGNTANVSQID